VRERAGLSRAGEDTRPPMSGPVASRPSCGLLSTEQQRGKNRVRA
jgi:hypothetical protein